MSKVETYLKNTKVKKN